MGRNPEDREEVGPGGDYPVRINVIFEGGPCDGNGELQLVAPPGLAIHTLEFTGHPEGFYQLMADGRFHWRLH